MTCVVSANTQFALTNRTDGPHFTTHVSYDVFSLKDVPFRGFVDIALPTLRLLQTCVSVDHSDREYSGPEERCVVCVCVCVCVRVCVCS